MKLLCAAVLACLVSTLVVAEVSATTVVTTGANLTLVDSVDLGIQIDKESRAMASGVMYYTLQEHDTLVALNLTSKHITKFRFPGNSEARFVASEDGHVLVVSFNGGGTQLMSFSPSGSFLWSNSVEADIRVDNSDNYRIIQNKLFYFSFSVGFSCIDIVTGTTKDFPLLQNANFVRHTQSEIVINQPVQGCVQREGPPCLDNIIVFDFAFLDLAESAPEAILFNATGLNEGGYHGHDDTYWYFTNSSWTSSTSTLLIYSKATGHVVRKLPYYNNVGGPSSATPALSQDGQLLSIIDGSMVPRLDVVNLTSGVVVKRLTFMTVGTQRNQLAQVPGAIVVWSQNFTSISYPGGDVLTNKVSTVADGDTTVTALGSSGLIMAIDSNAHVYVRSVATGDLVWTKKFASDGEVGEANVAQAWVPMLDCWVVTNNKTVEVYKVTRS